MSLIKKNHNEWYEPFVALSDMRTDLDRLFFGSLRNLRERSISGLFTPEVELSEDSDKFTVKTELPGMKKDEVEITLHGNVFVLKGEKKEEQEKTDKHFYHSERRYGMFERVIELASEVDASKIKAVFKDGVLEVTLPKSEHAKPKQIKVDIS